MTAQKTGQRGMGTRSHKPKSRGTRERNTVEMIDRLFLETIEITVDGRKRRVTNLGAIMLRLSAKEIAGSRKALRTRLKYEEFMRRGTKPELEIAFIDSEYTRAFSEGISDREGNHD